MSNIINRLNKLSRSFTLISDPADPAYGENDVYLKDYDKSKYNSHLSYLNKKAAAAKQHQLNAQKRQDAVNIGSSIDGYVSNKTGGKYNGNIGATLAPRYLHKIKNVAKAGIGLALVGAAVGGHKLYNKFNTPKANPASTNLNNFFQNTVVTPNLPAVIPTKKYSFVGDIVDDLHGSHEINDEDLRKDYLHRVDQLRERSRRSGGKDKNLFNKLKDKGSYGIGTINKGLHSYDVLVDNNSGDTLYTFDKRLNKGRIGVGAVGLGGVGALGYLLYRKIKRDRMNRNSINNQ